MSEEGEAAINPCRIFVGNLKFSTTNETLTEVLSEAGSLKSAETIKSGDGRSRGCAVAEYSTAEEAEQAKRLFTDREVDGRKIFVREDRENGAAPKKASKPRQRRQKKAAPDREKVREANPVREASPNQLFVRNIPWSTSEEELKSAFLEYGAISAEIKRRRNGESKGFGLVQFDNEEQAANALRELQGMELDGRDLELREDRPPRAVVQEA